MDIFEKYLRYNNIIIFFYQKGCVECIYFDTVWNKFYDLISKQNKNNIKLLKINVEETHKDIDKIWSEWKKGKINKSSIINKKNNLLVDDDIADDIGIFNSDSTNKNIIRGTPTILFKNNNNYYIWSKFIDKNIIQFCNICSLMFNDPYFAQQYLIGNFNYMDDNLSKTRSKFIYIYNPNVLFNNMINSMTEKSILGLAKIANNKLMSADSKIQQLFSIYEINDINNRYDLPYPSIYDIYNDKIYIYDDCIKFIDHVLQ